jgi:hypothetical protein
METVAGRSGQGGGFRSRRAVSDSDDVPVTAVVATIITLAGELRNCALPKASVSYVHFSFDHGSVVPLPATDTSDQFTGRGRAPTQIEFRYSA